MYKYHGNRIYRYFRHPGSGNRQLPERYHRPITGGKINCVSTVQLRCLSASAFVAGPVSGFQLPLFARKVPLLQGKNPAARVLGGTGHRAPDGVIVLEIRLEADFSGDDCLQRGADRDCANRFESSVDSE
jgi:hypothetical protein